jgi:hypothetical protein
MLNVRRSVTDHVVNPVNDLVKIDVVDDPGAGGANHEYLVSWPGCYDGQPVPGLPGGTRLINFQNGPIAENGVNGLTPPPKSTEGPLFNEPLISHVIQLPSSPTEERGAQFQVRCDSALRDHRDEP